jgi:hypothetical protein
MWHVAVFVPRLRKNVACCCFCATSQKKCGLLLFLCHVSEKTWSVAVFVPCLRKNVACCCFCAMSQKKCGLLLLLCHVSEKMWPVAVFVPCLRKKEHIIVLFEVFSHSGYAEVTLCF